MLSAGVLLGCRVSRLMVAFYVHIFDIATKDHTLTCHDVLQACSRVCVMLCPNSWPREDPIRPMVR